MTVFGAIRLSRAPASAFVIVGFFWGVFAAYVPAVKSNLGVGDAVFGSLLLATSVGLISAMWLAPKIDKILGDHSMQIAAVILGASFLLPGFARTPLEFALGMVVVGVGSGLLDVIMNARVSELEAFHGRPLMNANHGMFSVGYATAALVSGVAREAGIAPYQMFGVVGMLVCFCAVALKMPVYRAAEAGPRRRSSPTLAPILLCGSVVLIAFMAEAAIESWSALHVERTLGGRAAEGAMGPAMLGITMAIGRLSGQALSGRWNELTVILFATVLSGLGAMIAAVAPVPFVAYIGFGVLGLGVSVIAPIALALAGKMVKPHQRTKAISRVAVIGFAGFFLAPVLMGGISQLFGLRWAFVGVAVLLFGIFPLVGILKERLSQRPVGAATQS